jgi:hypothetical protein
VDVFEQVTVAVEEGAVHPGPAGYAADADLLTGGDCVAQGFEDALAAPRGVGLATLDHGGRRGRRAGVAAHAVRSGRRSGRPWRMRGMPSMTTRWRRRTATAFARSTALTLLRRAIECSARVATIADVVDLHRAVVVGEDPVVPACRWGSSIAHTLLARRPELLDRVVIDGCGALLAWWIGAMKLGVAVLSPFIHRAAVIAVLAQSVGMPAAGREQFVADMRAAAPRAFRRAFTDANNTRVPVAAKA